MLRRLLVTAATPIALAGLFAEPGRAQVHTEAATPVPAGEPAAPGPEALLAEGKAPPPGLAGTVNERGVPSLESGHAPEHEFLTNPVQNLFSLHYGKDDHGGEWEAGEHKMPPPFLAQVFNFVCFAWLLGRFAWPSIRRATRERHDEIARALAEGARLREEARARLDEYGARLAGLQDEIDRLVSGIRKEAEAESQRIIAEAERRAERMRRDAEQQIAAEMAQVRLTLEREAVEAAVGIAERLLREKTTDADQKALADRFLQGLQATAAPRRTPTV